MFNLRKMKNSNIVNLPTTLYRTIRNNRNPYDLIYVRGNDMVLTNKYSSRPDHWAIRVEIIRLGLRYYLILPKEYTRALKFKTSDTVFFYITDEGDIAITKFGSNNNAGESRDKNFNPRKIFYKHWWDLDLDRRLSPSQNAIEGQA